MNLLTYEEVLEIQRDSINQHGGFHGVKAGGEGGIQFAIEQPLMGDDYYPSIEDKTAAIGYSLAKGHFFIDGNKRVAFSAMYVFLQKNGYLLDVRPKEAISFMLDLAAGQKSREDLGDWINAHLSPSNKEAQTSAKEEERLSFGETSSLSPRVKQIEAERPSYWRAKMFAQVLTEEIEKCSARRAEHKQGYSSAPKRSLEQYEFFEWLGEETDKKLIILVNQERVVSLLSELSFSESLEHGDLDYMISFARELGGIYKEAIEWSQQFRELDMAPEYEPFLDSVSGFFGGYIDQLEQLPSIFLRELENAEISNGQVDHIHIVIQAGPNDPNAPSLAEEFNTLQAKLGLEDEQGLGADYYISEGLSGVMIVLGNVAGPIGDYLNDSFRWRKAFDDLDERPLFIAKPQREAIINSVLQRTRGATRAIEKQLTDCNRSIEILEKYGPLVGNLVNPAKSTSVDSARQALENIMMVRDTGQSAREWNDSAIAMIDLMSDLSSKMDAPSADLLRSVESYDGLLARLLSSCDVQIRQIETKLSN